MVFFLNFPIICEWKLKTWRVLAAWHASPHTHTHTHAHVAECVFVCQCVCLCVSISIGHELNWPVQQQNCFSNGNTTWNSHNKLLNNFTVLTIDKAHPPLISPSVCQRVCECVCMKNKCVNRGKDPLKLGVSLLIVVIAKSQVSTLLQVQLCIKLCRALCVTCV